jgi:hypothetical protein
VAEGEVRVLDHEQVYATLHSGMLDTLACISLNCWAQHALLSCRHAWGWLQVRFNSPPTALATKPFNNEEVQCCVEAVPGQRYILEVQVCCWLSNQMQNMCVFPLH